MFVLPEVEENPLGWGPVSDSIPEQVRPAPSFPSATRPPVQQDGNDVKFPAQRMALATSLAEQTGSALGAELAPTTRSRSSFSGATLTRLVCTRPCPGSAAHPGNSGVHRHRVV